MTEEDTATTFSLSPDLSVIAVDPIILHANVARGSIMDVAQSTWGAMFPLMKWLRESNTLSHHWTLYIPSDPESTYVAALRASSDIPPAVLDELLPSCVDREFQVPGGKYVMFKFKGSYECLPDAVEQATSRLKELKEYSLRDDAYRIERYHEDGETELLFPIS